jgi:hypothetical protein
MKAWSLAVLALGGCYEGAHGRGAGETTTGPSLEQSSSATSATAIPDDAESSSGDAIDDEALGLGVDEFDCVGTPVLEQSGVVLDVPAAGGELELVPLQPGEGFSCMRVELELDVTAITAPSEGCPVYAAIASIRGTAPGGEDMAAAYLHPYELGPDGCMRTEDRLAVGNFRELVDDAPAPPMSGTWHARLVVKPFVSRFEVMDDAGNPIARVSANLFPASIADTRDPVVRLGLADAIGETLLPWGSIVFRDVRIFADVAPPA